MTARWNDLIDMQNLSAHQRQSPIVMAISKPSVIAALVCTVLVPSLIPAGRVGAQPAGQWVAPAGFQVTVFAENVENAREMALGPQGTVFVGSMRAGKVHAVVDRDGDRTADRVVLIASGLDQPNGVAIRNGALNVATASKILRFDDIERRLDSPPAPVVVHRMMVAHTDGRRVTSYEPFVDGFMPGVRSSLPGGRAAAAAAVGRPVDVLQTPDGSILISDDMGNRLLRVSYRR